jgi:ATP-dependent helicase IRC3
LLEQAYRAFDDGVPFIAEPKSTMTVRVVSGTPGHYPVHRIKTSDDVVIGTLQTIGKAVAVSHPAIERFLTAAKPRLLVVFDEAHHSPAPSYRNLVLSLRKRISKMFLLGLTATPTYSQEEKKGWLLKIFPQGIVHQVTPQQLLVAGILAKPILEQPNTDFVPDFDERDYQKWLGTHRDLPEDIITQMALNRDRNLFIANYYAANKKRFGKTIIFADRWFQCEQISEFLRKRRIKTGSVYSHVDADPGSATARNRRKRDENAVVLQKFRDGKLDVLLNVRMLTEGTDVPDVKAVFLTRATTSQILLTQMVGRALRGPKFGGTEEAFIVSFIDNWKHLINWAEYDQLTDEGRDGGEQEYGKRPPVQLISIELVQQLSRQMDSGINMAPGPFVLLLPVGWYRVEFQTQVDDKDDFEHVRELVMVFEDERDSYQKFLQFIARRPIKDFESEHVSLDDVEEKVIQWRDRFFKEREQHFGTSLLRDLFRIARHTAQSGVVPRFFPFDERDLHDLDAIATQCVKEDLGPSAVDQELANEYNRQDRLWSTIYYRYDLFKSQFDACVNRILHARRHGADAAQHRPKRKPLPRGEQLNGSEPSEHLKEQVKDRDQRCLCCDSRSKRSWQVDHISPRYYGGESHLDNLQTLCGECNRAKGAQTINFRNTRTIRSEQPVSFPDLQLPTGQKAVDLEQWRRYIFRSINFFYQCDATDMVGIGKRGTYFYHWSVELNPGNDPTWVTSLLKNILLCVRRERAKMGYGVPDTITVYAPEHEEITVEAEVD